MTPDDAKRAWYAEMAQLYGRAVALNLQRVGVSTSNVAAEPLPIIILGHARIAAHFGRQALHREMTIHEIMHDECTCEIDYFDYRCPKHGVA